MADGAAPARREKAAQSGAAATKPRPNILLVTLDTVRADHCSAYGYARPTTPHLERMAAAGVRVVDAYAPMPSTLPSHATMFTGADPRVHGVTRNGFVLPEASVTLAELLAANGYATSAFVSSYPVHHRFGLAQGFATYDDAFAGGKRKARRSSTWEDLASGASFDQRGDTTRSRAVAWLRERGYLPQRGAAPAASAAAPPFFVWVHLFDAHDPYQPPSEERALFSGDTGQAGDVSDYDAELHFADRQLGELLDEIDRAGLAARTLVVVVGDHGQGLTQHGWPRHGKLLYEEAVRVPLVFLWPGTLPGGRVVAGPVELVDLAPTLLDLAAVDGRLLRPRGRTLAPVLRGASAGEAERPVVAQRRTFGRKSEQKLGVRGDKYAIRLGRWKYIEAREEGSFELYDLQSDPGELTNRAAAEPTRVAALRASLQRWLDATRGGATAAPVAKEDAARLRALGYVE